MQINTQTTRSVRKRLLPFFILFVLPFLIAEIILRFTTDNIYSQMSVIADEIPRGIRLGWPLDKSFNAAGLYEGAGTIRFRVHEKRYIYPGYEHTDEELILFFGSSQSESTMVPEGVRFSDLIGKSLGYYPMNFSRSANNVLESYLNFNYLMDKYKLHPKIVFVKQGMTDYGVFLKSGSAKSVSDLETLLDARNGSSNLDFTKQRVNSYIRKSYVIAHVYLASKKLFGVSYIEHLIRDATNQSPNMATEDQFNAFIESTEFRAFLSNRKETLRKFIDTAKGRGARVVVFTEPSTYSEDYKSYVGTDLRIFPVTLKGKRMDIAQSRRLHDMISKSTREAAKESNALLIDIDRYLSGKDPSPYLYDSAHYTEKGARLIAELAIQEIHETNFLEDNRWLQ
jgi:hypothetical protein